MPRRRMALGHPILVSVTHSSRPSSELNRLHLTHQANVSSWAWLGRLPSASSLSVAICLKGLHCSDVAPTASAEMAPANLYSCVEEPAGKEHGLESVCAFRLLVDEYSTRGWRGVFFLHDDVTTNRWHSGSYHQLRRWLQRGGPSAQAGWPREPLSITRRQCACELSQDLLRLDEGNYWYLPMRWWLREFFTPGSVYSAFRHGPFHFPIGFMFYVDRASIRRRGRLFWLAMYRLAREGVVLRGVGEAATPPLMATYSPHSLAHVFERLPQFLFGRPYAVRRDSTCLHALSQTANSSCGADAVDLLRSRDIERVRARLANLSAADRAKLSTLALPSKAARLVCVSSLST